MPLKMLKKKTKLRKLIVMMRQFKHKKRQMCIWCSVWINQDIFVEWLRCLELWEEMSDTMIFGDSQINGLALFLSIGSLSKIFLTLISFIWKILSMRTSLYAKEETAKKSLLKLVKKCFRFLINSNLKQEFLMIFRFMRNRRNIELIKKQSTKNGMSTKNKNARVQPLILIKSLKFKINILQIFNSI